MVRPKKTPVSSIISQRATTDKSLPQKNRDETIKNTSVDHESESEKNSEQHQNIKKRNIKNSPSKKQLSKKNETNDKNSLDSPEKEKNNNESNKNNASNSCNKKTHKDQASNEEKNIELDDEKSEIVKEKKRRKNAELIHKNNIKNNSINENPIEKEPRKRRLASLNAEFLVHYCSNTVNTNNLNSNENKKSNKVSDINSNSSKNDSKIANKRQRILSVESDNNKKNKKIRNETKIDQTSEGESVEEDDEVKIPEKNDEKIISKNKRAMTNSKNKTNEESIIENLKQKNRIRKGRAANIKKEVEVDAQDESSSSENHDKMEENVSNYDEDCSENDSTKRNKNYATRNNKSTKTILRKDTKKHDNRKNLRRNQNSKIDLHSESSEHESDIDEDSSNDEEIKKPIKKQKTVKQTNKNSKTRNKSKNDADTESTEEENAEDEKESHHSKNSFNLNKRKRKDTKSMKESVLNQLPLSSGRPKREAGLRASAMIIQTNEIEKTRFQYFSSATASSTSLQAPLTNQNTTTNKKKNSTYSLNQIDNPDAQSSNKKSKTNEQMNKSDENFQLPQPISLYNSLNTSTLSKSNFQNRKPINNKSRQNVLASSQFTSSQANQSSLNLNSRHLPSLTNNSQVNCAVGDDSSSNDVQILMETSPQKNNRSNNAQLNTSKSTNAIVERTLTEDLLAEHNKLYGTLGCGGGGFNNYTREYISKWALEYKVSDDKPFPPGQIPIESFGIKILNEPQYLQNKSRSGSSQSSNINSNQTTTVGAGAAQNSSVQNKSKTQSNSTQQLKTGHGNEVNLTESKTNVLNEQASSNNSTKNILNNNQIVTSLTNTSNTNNNNNNNNNNSNQQHAQKNFSSNNNTSNDLLNKKLNLASSKGINNAEISQLSNKSNANNTNILNENSNNGITTSNNINDSYSNNNNSSDNMNYFPRTIIASSSLNDILAASASSISLNKVISSNSAFNNLAAALNLNLSMPANNPNNFHQTNLNKKPFTPLVSAVAVAQSLQSFHQSKKITSTPLHSIPSNSGNFSFLNSINSTSSILSQPVTGDWQFNQSITKETQNPINELLSCEAINPTKNLEIWNKLKVSHNNLESLVKINPTPIEESIKTLSSISKTNSNLIPPSVNDQDYLRNKLKLDSKELAQDVINAPNMTMINVENLNFYTSIEGVHQQSHYLNHDLSCTGCLKTLNKNCYDHYRHTCNTVNEPASTPTHCIEIPAPQLQDQSLASHLNYTQATAAATAAAVAMNIAKILTVNSRNIAQSKTNDDLTEVKHVNNQLNLDASNIKFPLNKQHLKSNENTDFVINETNKSQTNIDQLGSTIKIETNIIDNLKNECEKDLDSTSTGKSDNSKSDLAKNSSQNDLRSKSKNKKSKKSSFIIQKDASALSCSCRIKLEPDSMTITIDTNKDNFVANEKEHNCCSHKNIQHIDLKLSPGKINISKKNKSCDENHQGESDSESEASSECSSSSGSIHLIVDEASTNIEASDSNISKVKIDLNESKIPANDTTEKIFSESNYLTVNESKDNISSPTSFFFNNKNSLEAETITTLTTKTPESRSKKWTVINSESDNPKDETETIKSKISLIDTSKEVKLNVDDYVIFNSDKLVVKSKNEVKFTLFNDATNESSNTNYSIEYDEDESKVNTSKIEQENTLCFGQICDISNEVKSNNIVLKLRALLRPEQIQITHEKTFDQNELILSNFYFEEFDAEYLIDKCTILDKENYEKLKSTEEQNSNASEEEKNKKDSKKKSDTYFFRCEYDYFKKNFIY